jgi:hypothetical protein
VTSLRRLLIACVLVAAALAVPVSARQRKPPLDTSVDAVVAKAADYVREYRDQLTYVMATERYTQTLTGGFSLYDMDETLASDVFFVYVPADKVWMAIRDVEIVDGKVLKERANVRSLLNSGQVGAARALKDKNALYNLGTIVRNFNEPTLSLLVLDDDHRSHFTFVRQKVSGGRVIVSFVEHATPTLIQNVDGTAAFSKGELTIDAATGRVEHATLQIRLGKVDATLTTTYQMNDKLRMWVPARFDELYVEDGRRPQRVTGRATYSDYSRFDVEVRIKTPTARPAPQS